MYHSAAEKCIWLIFYQAALPIFSFVSIIYTPCEQNSIHYFKNYFSITLFPFEVKSSQLNVILNYFKIALHFSSL